MEQDPSVHGAGVGQYDMTWLGPQLKVADGPMDSRVRLAGPPIKGDENRDFIIKGNSQADRRARRAVHTYGNVQRALKYWEDVTGDRISWAWNRDGGDSQQITIHPEGLPGEANAYYSRWDRAIKFGTFTPGDGMLSKLSEHKGPLGKLSKHLLGSEPLRRVRSLLAPGDTVYTAESAEVIWHETGHAILDSQKPGFLGTYDPQTGALHEAFGDLTAIFTAIDSPKIRAQVIAHTKGNLKNYNAVASLAEEFGLAMGKRTGLRNALNKVTLTEAGNEVHSISRVFTGGMYDALAEAYNEELDRLGNTQHEQALRNAGRYVSGLLWNAIQAQPEHRARFDNMAIHMMRDARQDGHERTAEAIRRTFTWRDVLGPSAEMAASNRPGAQIEADPNGTIGRHLPRAGNQKR